MTTLERHETPRRVHATPVADRYVVGLTLLAAVFSLVAGVSALFWPGSFAEAVKFPEHTHYPAPIPSPANGGVSGNSRP